MATGSATVLVVAALALALPVAVALALQARPGAASELATEHCFSEVQLTKRSSMAVNHPMSLA